MTTHNLKSWPSFFEDAASGRKPFELRRDDRDFAIGDILRLEEFRPAVGEYTGRNADVIVTYIMRYDRHTEKIGLPRGYCILGISSLNPVRSANPRQDSASAGATA